MLASRYRSLLLTKTGEYSASIWIDFYIGNIIGPLLSHLQVPPFLVSLFVDVQGSHGGQTSRAVR